MELHTFWISPGERPALDVLINSGKEKQLNINTIYHDDYDVLRNHIADRLALGYPPDFSHWIATEDLSSAILNMVIMSIPATANGEPVSRLLHENVINQLTHDDEQIYFLPVGIHIMNSSVYNRRLLAQLGYDTPPDNWEDFFEMTEKAVAGGIIPIALTDNSWYLRILFTSILLSIDGYRPMDMMFSRDLRDKEQLMETFEESFEVFLKLRAFADKSHINRYWADATRMVIENRAVVQFIGDFARSELIAMAEEDIQNFECVAPPGNPTSLWDVDVFLMYNTGKEIEKKVAQRLADVVLDPKTQAGYVYYKGGLPVIRQEINPDDWDDWDDCAKTSFKRWNEQSNIMFASPFDRDLSTISILRYKLFEIWKDSDIDAETASKRLYDAMFLEN